MDTLAPPPAGPGKLTENATTDGLFFPSTVPEGGGGASEGELPARVSDATRLAFAVGRGASAVGAVGLYCQKLPLAAYWASGCREDLWAQGGKGDLPCPQR